MSHFDFLMQVYDLITKLSEQIALSQRRGGEYVVGCDVIGCDVMSFHIVSCPFHEPHSS